MKTAIVPQNNYMYTTNKMQSFTSIYRYIYDIQHLLIILQNLKKKNVLIVEVLFYLLYESLLVLYKIRAIVEVLQVWM